MFLVADCGATNTRIALIEDNQTIKRAVFRSQKIRSLSRILKKVQAGRKLDAACIGIAGKVKNGVCTPTHLPWVVNKKDLEKTLSARVVLLNDVACAAYAIPSLKRSEIVFVTENVIEKERKAKKDANKRFGEGISWKHDPSILIIPGTGLGVARIKNKEVIATEAGHEKTSFAARNKAPTWKKKWKKEREKEWEGILSGSGLERIYKEKTGNFVLPELITTSKSKHAKSACIEFVQYLARFALILSLRWHAKTIFLSGNIVNALLPKYKDAFCTSFFKDNKKETARRHMQVVVVKTKDLGLRGAGEYLKSAEEIKKITATYD